MDDCDSAWLQVVNGERAQAGLSIISEDQLERVIEQLELHCWDKIQTIMKNEEGLGIEYDENVICDVCRSPDSEEGNEMVFCDSCNICVHQACYGIMTIPAGQWLCCTCSLGQRPECVLCPNKGGAMKCTRSGQKWAHVSCALWIPEVSIGCVEKMEPITKISSIPQSRWALICVLCRERVGACIQCSVKTCKTAYHVTCAFKHGLEMRAIIEDENADDGVKLRSYCQKHSVSSKKEKSVCSGSEDDDNKRKKRKDMTSEEKNQARAARLQEIEAEFDKHVSVKDIMQLEVDSEGLYYIYNYWKLKRRAGHNKPLLPPKSEDVDMLSHKQEQADLEKMKMFVQLRQDLERVRNLCYMVSRREKLSRTFFRMREQTFHKQVAVLSSAGHTMTSNVISAVIEANHGPSIYDRLYSHPKAEDHTVDFETILARIAGLKSPVQDSGDEKNLDLNGVIKDRKLSNPYKRLYFNGSSKRRSLYGSSLSSASSSEIERKVDIHHNSSTDNEKVTLATTKKKVTRVRKTSENAKAAERRRNRLNNLASNIKVESSSEEDDKPIRKDWSTISKSKTLRKMEQELGEKNISATDSDELMPIRLSKPGDVKTSAIYSDSDTSDTSTKNEDKSSNATSDSQQNKLKTKASVKEFSLLSKPQSGASSIKTNPKKKNEDEELKKDISIQKSPKKKDPYDPTELIVPQRQAAKKASENLKTTTSRSKEPINNLVSESETKGDKIIIEEKDRDKIKMKPKTKITKETKESKEIKEKELKKDTIKLTGNKTPDVFDIEKEFEKEDNQEILAYVPQRQAAKKAAEHIKSGLVKPLATDQNELESSRNKKELEKEPKTKLKELEVSKSSKKDVEQEKINKKDSEKVTEVKRKCSTSSSSSSVSSSTSSTSSSSDSEEDNTLILKKSHSIVEKQPPLSVTLFSSSVDNSKQNTTKDWPFLDKATKSADLIPFSSSDSNDSSQRQHLKKPQSNKAKSDSKIKPSVSRTFKSDTTMSKTYDTSKTSSKKFRKVTDKKLKTSEKRLESDIKSPVSEREESSRQSSAVSKSRSRTKRQSNTSDRVRDANVWPGNISDGQCVSSSLEQKTTEVRDHNQSPKKEQQAKLTSENRKRKSDEMGHESITVIGEQFQNEVVSKSKTDKESIKSSKLPSPVRKTDKKLIDKIPEKHVPSQLSNLEREIMERKAGRDVTTKKPSKIALDKLLEKRDKKIDKQLDKEVKHSSAVVNKHDFSNCPSSKFKDNEASTKTTDLDHVSEQIQTKKSSPRYKKPEPLPDIVRKNIDVSRVENKKSELGSQKSHELKDTMSKETVLQKADIGETSEDLLTLKESEKTNNTLQPYSNRSIFSPQPIKENTCNEMFDFDNDMLNVDEAANDDGFNLPREEEGVRAPLSFTYAGSELLFKEDSKEDSARETLNLVEKLRMELSKKSTGTGHGESSEEITLKDEVENVESVTEVINTSLTTPKEASDNQNQVEMTVEITEQPSLFPNTETNYHYSSCESDMNTKTKSMTVQENNQKEHCANMQTGEKWIPLSDTFSIEMQQEKLYSENHMSLDINKQSFIHSTDLHNQINILPKHDIILPEELHKEQSSPVMQERLQQHTTFIEQTSVDCMPSSSPYTDIHQQAKWADSEVLPVRRSSSSSAASTSSTASQRNEDIEMPKREDMIISNHPGLLQDMTFGMLPQGNVLVF